MRRAVEVAVIGGGIAGTATAALLAEAGLRVRLHERRQVAAGASGRNSGVVQHPFDPVLADLYHRSLPAYRRLEAALDGAFALPATPSGLLFLGGDVSSAAKAAAAWAAAWPATAPEVLEGRAVTDLEPAIRPGLAACRLEMAYPVAPAAATEAFAALASRAGAEIVVGEPGTVAIEDGRAVGVAVGGVIEPAGQVVVAAGPWTPALVDPSGGWRPIRSVWGVVASIALEDAPRHGLEAIDIDVEPREAAANAAAVTAASGGESAAVRDDDVDFSLAPSTGHSALGSTFLPTEPDPATWVEALRRVGARYVPAVATAPLHGVRHCARPVSRDGRPLIGRIPWIDGAWVIAGHGPWGISTGPGSAGLLVDEMLGRGGLIADDLAPGRFGEPVAQRQDSGSKR